jgi:putative component of membrane protein insertase Oxa1/YidC/SpoIIIJ protein YidD
VDSLAASKLLGKRKPRVITSGAISQFCRAQLVSSWLEVVRRVQRESEAPSARTASRLCDGGGGCLSGSSRLPLRRMQCRWINYCRLRRASALAALGSFGGSEFFATASAVPAAHVVMQCGSVCRGGIDSVRLGLVKQRQGET